MAYRLSRGESIHHGVLRIADEELGTAVDALRDRAGDPHARVHTARKAIKRMRALARLVRRALGSRHARDDADLRDAARRVARQRDAAVAADVLSKLVPGPTPALAAIRERLVAAREQVNSEPDLEAAADDLARVRERCADWPAFARDWDVIEPGLRTSYARGRAAMAAAFANPDAEAFHAWRRRAKDLWYHTLLLAGVWKSVQTAWADALEDLCDLLGEDHDLEVLRLALAAHPDLDPDACRELCERAAVRSTQLRTDAWVLGQRLYAERPRRYVRRIGRYWAAWRSDERHDARKAERAARPPCPERLPLDPEVICPGESVHVDMN